MFTTHPTRTLRSTERPTVSVVVYGTSWGAASQRVRRYLDRLGIAYYFRDMEFDPEAARRDQWWTGGYASHPTLQIGGQVLAEPSLDEIDWVLSRHGLM